MAAKSIDTEITEITKRHRSKLQNYVLENIKKVSGGSTENEDEVGAGRGAYGKVIYLDYNGTLCVGKKLHTIFFDPGTDPSGIQHTLEKFFSEIELLSKMKHSNVVRFIGIFYQQDTSLPVLVMEKMECNLTQYLDTHEKESIPEDRVLRILLGVSKGLVYLHEEMKVAHRDLSSNNILLAADLSAKIADLGSARVLDRPGGWNSSAKLTVQPGILDFMPPEALEDPPKYTVSVDVFSFGCVIIHLHTHKWPSPSNVPKGMFISEIQRRQKYIAEMAGSYLLPMVMQCLSEKTEDRPASADLMSLLQAKVEEKQPDYTIVFAGITGTGKSTAGNFFFKKEVFSSGGGLLSVTSKCSAATSTICGKTVKIVDTPGFFDGFTSAEENFGELSKTLTLAKDGIHSVVFVMNNNRYTEQCENAIKQLLLFKGLGPFLFVLLTHAKDEGVTKAATDEYIQQTLSNPRCPPGLKSLMQLVKNRVIMLESTNTVEHYHAQKSTEFIMMIEEIHKSNAYKIYTNLMLQHTTQIYEKAKLQQQAEIRMAMKMVQSNEEKIQQLKKQANDSTKSEATKKISDEIVALKLALEEIADEDYLENFTNKTLRYEMEKSKITAKNIMQFIDLFTMYQAKRRDLPNVQRFLTYQTIGTGALGGVVGGAIGAIVGSVVPGTGTADRATSGAQIGAVIGALVGDSYESASKAYDDCKQQ